MTLHYIRSNILQFSSGSLRLVLAPVELGSSVSNKFYTRPKKMHSHTFPHLENMQPLNGALLAFFGVSPVSWKLLLKHRRTEFALFCSTSFINWIIIHLPAGRVGIIGFFQGKEQFYQVLANRQIIFKLNKVKN